jgi:molybdopterin-guanine dinucleotide biosynthesis protein A
MTASRINAVISTQPGGYRDFDVGFGLLTVELSSCAILAGGRATRFDGRDKGALVVAGRTILDRQIAELSQITRDLLIVGGEVPAAPLADVRYVADLVPGCGPLGGLHAALSEAQARVVVIVACDMPFVSAPLIRHLLAIAAGPDMPDVVVPRTERGYHPLCAVYTRACLGPVARRLANRQLRMDGLFEDVRVRAVTADALAPFGDPGHLLANLNTPLEYRAIEAKGIQS